MCIEEVHGDLRFVKEVVVFSMTCRNNALYLRNNMILLLYLTRGRIWISFSLIVGICILSVSV